MGMKKPRTFQTASEAIDAMGGTNAVARMLGLPKQTVSSWKRGGLPARRYYELREFFADQDIRLARSAWAMDPPLKAAC
jgi:hypothetical protein